MSTSVPQAELLTVAEAAQLLRQSEKSVRRKIHAGQIQAVRLGDESSSPLRIPADELRSWLYGEAS